MRKIFVYMAIFFAVCALSSCGSPKVKDEDSAYTIIDTWEYEHGPLSEKDSSFAMDTEGGFQTQIIDGDKYYSSVLKITYRNEYYYQNYQLGRDSAYENLITKGTIYVREKDGSVYVEFTGVMEPIDEWHADFDDWVMAVAPVGYDRFIIAPILHDFVNVTDYSNPYGDGWVYELSWESMDIAKGYEVEYVESSPGNDEPYREIYEVEDNFFTVGASVSVEVTVRVRAYVEDDGERIYGEWSEPQSVILGSDDPAQYWNVTWQELMRYPESYIDEEVQLPKVTVLQDVGNGIYRVWDSDLKVYAIDISNVSSTKILEGDSLVVQGKYIGIKTFNMTNGSTEDYPYIAVEYYEIQNLY